jgi:hypothetical protein
MAVNLGDSPVILTLIKGYGPFTPDAGIFCGGYQGPLYPNPTTFVIPDFIFNLRPYMDSSPTRYTMQNTGDVYDSGFDKGDPGIKYGNPGHLLGILDTFGRMSYGLGVIKAARQGIESFDIQPVQDINIPFTKLITLTTTQDVTIGLADIYPAYSEIPTKYLIGFVVDGELILDPRTSEPYVFGGTKYSPDTNEINFDSLFNNLLLRSYVGIPETFREYFSILANNANDFNLQEAVTLSSDQLGGTPGQLIVDLPNPIEDVDVFPTGDNSTVFPEDADFFGEYEYINECASMSVSNSLKALTGISSFHQNTETNYEYRSLTELNSVINILPVQINGLKYYYTIDTSSATYPSYPLNGGIVYVSYCICDICFTTFQKDIITINCSANIETIDDVLDNFSHKNVLRQFLVSHSVTNNFSWDRKWFDISSEDSSDITSEDNFYISESLDDGLEPDADPGFDILPVSNDFSSNLVLPIGDGSHTVRVRIIIKSKVLTDFGQPDGINGYEQLTLGLTINSANINISKDFVQL